MSNTIGSKCAQHSLGSTHFEIERPAIPVVEVMIPVLNQHPHPGLEHERRGYLAKEISIDLSCMESEMDIVTNGNIHQVC